MYVKSTRYIQISRVAASARHYTPQRRALIFGWVLFATFKGDKHAIFAPVRVSARTQRSRRIQSHRLGQHLHILVHLLCIVKWKQQPYTNTQLFNSLYVYTKITLLKPVYTVYTHTYTHQYAIHGLNNFHATGTYSFLWRTWGWLFQLWIFLLCCLSIPFVHWHHRLVISLASHSPFFDPSSIPPFKQTSHLISFLAIPSIWIFLASNSSCKPFPIWSLKCHPFCTIDWPGNRCIQNFNMILFVWILWSLGHFYVQFNSSTWSC